MAHSDRMVVDMPAGQFEKESDGVEDRKATTSTIGITLAIWHGEVDQASKHDNARMIQPRSKK